MKGILDKKNLPYLYILIIIAICVAFGTTRALPIIGFNAVAVMFGIAIVLSLLIRGPLNASPNRGEDSEEDD